MKKIKKEYPEAAKALLEYFNKEIVGDTELQHRYNGFLQEQECYGEQLRKLNIENDGVEEKLENIRQVIVRNAVLEIYSPDVIKLYNETEIKLTENQVKIQEIGAKWQYNTDLIKKYKGGSEDKLYHFWDCIKTLDSKTPSLPEFRKVYENKIF